MITPRKQTAALIVALLAAIAGSWGRIVFELSSLQKWKRYVIGMFAALILSLLTAYALWPFFYK